MSADGPAGRRDLALGGVILAGAAGLLYQASRNSVMMADFGADPGPAFQPFVLLGLLILAGAALVVEGLVRLAGGGWHAGGFSGMAQSYVFPALMVASLIAYVALVEVIGFFIASLLLTVSWAAILVAQDYGLLKIRPLAIGVIGAVLFTTATFVVFRELIGVPLD